MDEHPVVVEVGNVIAAESAVAFLATNDIDAWVEGANMAAMHYPDKRSIKVRVAAADLDAARELILDTPLVMASCEDQSEDMLAEPVNCPQCHSTRIRSGRLPWPVMLILILLLVGIPLIGSMNKDWTCKDCGHHWHVG